MYDSDALSICCAYRLTNLKSIATADIGAQIHQGSPHLFTDFALWGKAAFFFLASLRRLRVSATVWGLADYQNTSSTSNVSGHCDRYDNVRSSKGEPRAVLTIVV